jgi:hypothetical protein
MADGLKTALALLDGQAQPLPRGQQLNLLPDETDEGGDLPLVAGTVRQPGSKGGRPAGRRNRSTDEWARYIGLRYPSPLVALAETWSRSVRELAEELELYRVGSDGKPVLDPDGKPLLNLIEAFKLQQSAMVNALPYLHSKMPQAVQVQGKTRGLLIIGDLGKAGVDGDALTLNIADYQEVSEGDNEQSDVGKVG